MSPKSFSSRSRIKAREGVKRLGDPSQESTPDTAEQKRSQREGGLSGRNPGIVERSIDEIMNASRIAREKSQRPSKHER